jgi:hypothetical protein
MLPAESVAQRRLDRPDELQEIGIDVGHHVGRHGQRQNQRPIENAPPGKIVHRGQPGGRDAEHADATANAEAQPQRIQDVFRQHGLRQMRPGAASAAHKEIEADARYRQPGQQGDDEADDQQGRVLGCAHGSEWEL